MSPSAPRQILLFVPHYLGSLRYYEKLIPILREKYDIEFLFLPSEKDAFRPDAMVAYAKERGYTYTQINLSQHRVIKAIPFLGSLLRLFSYRKSFRSLFNERTYLTKIVTPGDTSPLYVLLLQEANSRGIDTMVLQWALTYEREKKERPRPPLYRRAYLWLFMGILSLFRMRIAVGEMAGTGNAKRMGVINKPAFDLFVREGVDAKKLSIVGYADFSIAEEVAQQFTESNAREHVAQKYDIHLSKKNIVLFETPFHVKDLRILSNEEQMTYYENIVKTIREVMPDNEADILFKIHPASSTEVYAELAKKYGVKIFDKNANNEELCALSDLYIDHHSTTNYIPIVLKKEALFLNFLKLDFLEVTKKYYGIHTYLRESQELQKALLSWKKNVLPLQYEKTTDILPEHSLDTIRQWIDSTKKHA